MSQTMLKLTATIRCTFYSAELRVISSTKPLILPTLKTEQPFQATSQCLYKFECDCSASYLGRTERRLESRIAEHVPKWLEKNDDIQHKTPVSSIGRHLFDTGHVIDPKKAFRVILRTQSSRALRFAEALAIQRLKPSLCVQKQLYVTLRLPW